jgi:SAM-dependent methyltransferase
MPAMGRGSRWLRRYYLSEVQSYLRFLVSPGQSVLLVDSHDGELLAGLQPSRGVGLDSSPELLAEARRRHPDLVFAPLDVEFSAVQGTFDVIILSHVVDFMEDVQTQLQGLRRLCRPGTRLLLITHNYLWAPLLVWLERLGLKRAKGAYAWLTLDDLQNLLSFAGFEAITRGFRTPMPVWLPGLSWLLNRVVGKLPGLWRLGIDQWVVARPVHLPPTEEPSVSIIIPCRNERGTVAQVIDRTPLMGRRTEFIFVEGHSTDGTREALHELQALRPDRDIAVLAQRGRGKADAMHQGMAEASGDIVVILDADLSVDPEALPRFVEALTSGYCEMALGSRLVYPMPAQAMRPLNMIGNMFFGRAFSFLLGQQVKDTLCGTKAFWRRDYERLSRQRAFFGMDDPFGDFDLILGAAKLQLRIREIPVRYRERVYGRTNIRRWRDGLRLLGLMVRGLGRMKLQ